MAHLGIDIGGTKVALRGVFGENGVRDSSFRWPRARTLRHDLDALADHVTQARATWPGEISAVGVAMPGTVTADGLVVAWPSRSHWVGVDFDSVLRRLFPGVRVRHGDDGDLAALAEAEGAGCTDLVYVGVGTGVGGGLVLGGRSPAESGRGSCEIGHMIIDRHGEQCVCGRRGCVQAVASGPATLTRASRRRGAAVELDDLLAGLRDGQTWAVSSVDDGCMAIAAAATSVIELLHPSAVVIGGGFAAAVDGFVDRVARHVEELTRPGQERVLVKPAAHGGLSSLHGAVVLAGRP